MKKPRTVLPFLDVHLGSNRIFQPVKQGMMDDRLSERRMPAESGISTAIEYFGKTQNYRVSIY